MPGIGNRELWQNIMNYGEFERMPVVHWGCWRETLDRWVGEGMPTDRSEREYLNADPYWNYVGIDTQREVTDIFVLFDLYPPFEEETLEETDEYSIFRGKDGVIQKALKKNRNISQCVDFTLKGSRDWEEYKRRLQPNPERIPADFDAQIASAENSDQFLAIPTAPLMGWIRNWMGVENMCYLIYDDPDVYADMVNTLAELTCWAIDQVIPRMKGRPDMGFGWEDICGRSGPLVSPDIFKRFVAPGYLKIRSKLEEYDVKLLGIDSDGDMTMLVRHWLDAGVNVFLPFEIGAWDADPMAYRKEYGKEMRIIGGFNKLVLEDGPAAINAEIERRLPLAQDGGYIMMPDHLITPDTPLENYEYYLERIRALRFSPNYSRASAGFGLSVLQ